MKLAKLFAGRKSAEGMVDALVDEVGLPNQRTGADK